MNEELEDKILSELFRRKLENAEVIPSPSAGSDVMRRLGRMEFLRFNPLRFNIWYAGGIVTAGAALAIIFSSGNNRNNSSVPDGRDSNPIAIFVNPGKKIKVQEEQGVAIDVRVNEKQTANALEVSPDPAEAIATDGHGAGQTRNVPSRPEGTGTLTDAGMIRESDNEKNRLRNNKNASDLFQASVKEGCVPLRVVFGKKAPEYDSCRWTFQKGAYSYEKNPEWIFRSEGEYLVTLQIFDSEGLISEVSSVIKVNPRPSARFEILAANTFAPDNEISFINYSSDALKFKWHFGDGTTSELFEPRHTYKSSGNYDISLVAVSGKGCSDTLTISNTYSGYGYFINFPNAFIPNSGGPSGGQYSSTSDEAGHIFHPFCSGVSEYQLKIFSKTGVLVFETNDINIGWDGYYKGQLSERGVYIWKVQGSFLNGEPFAKAGDLTLLKN